MKIFPTKIVMVLLCTILITAFLSCSKDSDLFADAITNDPRKGIDGQYQPGSGEEPEEPETDEETPVDEDLEERTFTFNAIEDAAMDATGVIDQDVMLLEDSNMTVFVMFDLSQVNGEIMEAQLDFTIDTDEGDGTIQVYKGSSAEWSEADLSSGNAPQVDALLGQIQKSFSAGTTESVELDPTGLTPEMTSIILVHKVGNSLSIASKENAAHTGPQLTIRYMAPKGSAQIVQAEEEEEQPEAPVVVAPEPEVPDPGLPAGGVKASSFGYNTQDATSAFRQALNSSNEIIIIDKQAGDWIIRPTEIRNLRNKQIYFQEGVVLRAMPGAFGEHTDRLLNLIEAENVEIHGYGAEFKMNKSEYNSGEWRHTLQLSACRNITVNGLKLSGSGGDGIYIGGNGRGTYSRDIYINDVLSTNHRRQGISVISAENLYVTNSSFTNTKGALPEAGVDIEPNNPDDRIVNVNFQGCSFTNNNHAGILLALMHLDSSSNPVSITFKDCYLSNNHVPENSYVATEIAIIGHRTDPAKGNVLFENIRVENSRWGLMHAAKLEKAFHVTLRNVTATNICRDNTMPAIKIRVQNKDNPDPIGGFTFENVTLDYEGSQPFFAAQGSAVAGVANVNGLITVKSSQEKDLRFVDYNPLINVNFNLDFNWIN